VDRAARGHRAPLVEALGQRGMSGRPRLLIVNPNTSASVTRWLAEEAERVARGRAEIAAVNAPSGLAAIETPDDLKRAAQVVVATIERDAGADAAIIGAFGDPGLMDARARLSIPVVGLGEAGLKAAATGGRFSIVTLGEAMRTALAERIRSLGLEDRLAEIRILPVTIPDMIANREAHLGAIADAIRLCLGDAVLLGGAPLAGLGTKMAEETGVTVLDGVEASVAAAMRMLESGV
jgi:Asp/Glu/hydantoin racemase